MDVKMGAAETADVRKRSAVTDTICTATDCLKLISGLLVSCS